MSSDIFGERFTSRELPAWWDVAGEHVHREPLSATAALERIGSYDVRLSPLYGHVERDLWVDAPAQMIVRAPVEEDPEYRPFGVVGPEYVLITPQDAAMLWDEHVARPVETVGALRDGRLLFITTKLPTIDVHGDEVENYLGLISPMDGTRAASVEVFPVRVVCRNTLNLAQSLATEVYRVVHDQSAKERLGSWLTDVYERAMERVEVVREAFDILAEHQVNEEELTSVLTATYPDAPVPREDAPTPIMEERFRRAQMLTERMWTRRHAAREMFEGAGHGMDIPATRGTSWGLYNAVTETEDWRRSNADMDRVTESLVIGARADAKRRAFDACLAIAKN